ncbi:MAG: hypothetical protein CMJ80_02790 [Planctomycetaceae bacterium]|nr:hypothetical protein [Planctomycetaceae bacterium]
MPAVNQSLLSAGNLNGNQTKRDAGIVDRLAEDRTFHLLTGDHHDPPLNYYSIRYLVQNYNLSIWNWPSFGTEYDHQRLTDQALPHDFESSGLDNDSLGHVFANWLKP